MITRRTALRLLGGGGAAILAGCSLAKPTRYKMLVEIETPQGVVSGASVRQVNFTPKSGTFFAEGSATWKVRGEAVAVDLPNSRTLFALLSGSDGAYDYAGRDVWLMLDEDRKNGGDGVVELWPTLERRVTRDPAASLPMLVTFRNAPGSTSIERVDPTNLAANFGHGVVLKRITVQTTYDRVTEGVQKRLPPQSEKGFYIWNGQASPNEKGIVGIWDFVRNTG